jgi:hypothetical protein
MSAVVDAAIGSIPFVGDAYGLLTTFGSRGTAVLNAIKRGDARAALASTAALGVESAAEAIPDTPIFGFVHAATGKRPETMAADMVEQKILSGKNAGGQTNTGGAVEQEEPVAITDKQREAIHALTKDLVKAVESGKPIDKSLRNAFAKVEKTKGLSPEAKEQAKTLAAMNLEVSVTKELADKALKGDQRIDKDEQAAIDAAIEEVREASKKHGGVNLKDATEAIATASAQERSNNRSLLN